MHLTNLNMRLVTWNVRGMNKVHSQTEIKQFIRDNKFSIIALIQHKIKEHNVQKVIQKIA